MTVSLAEKDAEKHNEPNKVVNRQLTASPKKFRIQYNPVKRMAVWREHFMRLTGLCGKRGITLKLFILKKNGLKWLSASV